MSTPARFQERRIQALEEKSVRRQASLKAPDHGKVEEAAKGPPRQAITVNADIPSDNTCAVNRLLEAIAARTAKGFGIPPRFENLRG